MPSFDCDRKGKEKRKGDVKLRFNRPLLGATAWNRMPNEREKKKTFSKLRIWQTLRNICVI
jgi:hypothetical protein